MRIAFFVDVFPRLSNTFIINQITGLLERGHDVDIFAGAAGDFGNAHSDVEEYGLEERMRHLPVPRGRFNRMLVAIRQLARPASRHPLALDALNPIRHGKEALTLKPLYSTLSFLQNRDYDIVHCQFGKLGPTVLPLFEHGVLKGKLVTSFRGADLTRHLPNEPEAYRRLFRVGDLFLPVSENFRRRLIEFGCDPRKVTVHHSGIRCERFPFRERSLQPGDTVRLLFIGRLTEKKGVLLAAEAFARAVAVGYDLEFTVIGGGEEQARLERRLDELGVRPRVQLLGPQEQSVVIERLQRSHLLVAPSLTASDGDQEGIPNVLKEAMATGIPVLSTRHSGIPELVEDGVSGFLVPEGDAEALADRLVRLVREPERWAAMGRAGRKKVEAEFDSEVLSDELVRLYRGLGEEIGADGRASLVDCDRR